MNIKSQKNSSNKKEMQIKKSSLYKELAQCDEVGIALWLNGHPSNPRSIVKACSIKEESNYMRDYYSNDQHKIYGIGFDRI